MSGTSSLNTNSVRQGAATGSSGTVGTASSDDGGNLMQGLPSSHAAAVQGQISETANIMSDMLTALNDVQGRYNDLRNKQASLKQQRDALNGQIAALDPNKKDDKKQLDALIPQRDALNQQIGWMDEQLAGMSADIRDKTKACSDKKGQLAQLQDHALPEAQQADRDDAARQKELQRQSQTRQEAQSQHQAASQQGDENKRPDQFTRQPQQQLYSPAAAQASSLLPDNEQLGQAAANRERRSRNS